MSRAKREIFLVIFYNFLPNGYFFELFLAFFSKSLKIRTGSCSQQVVNAARKERYNSAVNSFGVIVEDVHHVLSALVSVDNERI